MKIQPETRLWPVLLLVALCWGALAAFGQMSVRTPGGSRVVVVEVPLPLTNIVFNNSPTSVSSNSATNVSYTWSGTPEYLRAIVAITNGVPYFTMGHEPFCTNAVTVSGTVEIGQTLTAGVGVWVAMPAVSATSYQWFTNSTEISGANSSTFSITTNEVGFTLMVSVTKTNLFGQATEYSAATAVVPDEDHFRIKNTATLANMNGGTGYGSGGTVNLTVVGGTYTTAAVLQGTIEEDGHISGYTLVTPGDYTVKPSDPVSLSGGDGSGAQVALTVAGGGGDDWELFTP
jgi:hypothetical protein